MVQLSATRCSCIAILWVSLVSFATMTLRVASQRVFIVVSVYFVIDSVRKLFIPPRRQNKWLHIDLILLYFKKKKPCVRRSRSHKDSKWSVLLCSSSNRQCDVPCHVLSNWAESSDVWQQQYAVRHQATLFPLRKLYRYAVHIGYFHITKIHTRICFSAYLTTPSRFLRNRVGRCGLDSSGSG
jgi:hypothetical protein